MRPYVIVAPDLAENGGMDMANLALARYVARRGNELHVVTHRCDAGLAAMPNVKVHMVQNPLGSYFLGEFRLRAEGRRVAAQLASRGARVVVNGGNCDVPDVNWIHYVHAAFRPQGGAGLLRKIRLAAMHGVYLRDESRAIRRARLVIANSHRTQRDLVEHLGIDERRIRVVHYGADPARFRPLQAAERAELRATAPWRAGAPALAFVGALGDRRKNFDTLLAAWQLLAAEGAWDCQLVVIGRGAELPLWKERVKQQGLAPQIHFLGFRTDVPKLLGACDALVSPTRYESFGLAVFEALCMGIPAIVSRDAGVAEVYSPELRGLLLDNPNDAAGLAAALRGWREKAPQFRAATMQLAARLHEYTWDMMAARMVELMEEGDL